MPRKKRNNPIDDIDAITKIKNSELTDIELAEIYNVEKQVINNIRKGTWRYKYMIHSKVTPSELKTIIKEQYEKVFSEQAEKIVLSDFNGMLSVAIYPKVIIFQLTNYNLQSIEDATIVVKNSLQFSKKNYKERKKIITEC